MGTELLTYDKARRSCMERGGDLASIADKEEEEFLEAEVISEADNYWLGLDDQTVEGQFEWVDRLA